MEVLEDRLPKFFQGVVGLHKELEDQQKGVKNRQGNHAETKQTSSTKTIINRIVQCTVLTVQCTVQVMLTRNK